MRAAALEFWLAVRGLWAQRPGPMKAAAFEVWLAVRCSLAQKCLILAYKILPGAGTDEDVYAIVAVTQAEGNIVGAGHRHLEEAKAHRLGASP